MRKVIGLLLLLLLVSCSSKELKVTDPGLYSYSLDGQKRLCVLFLPTSDSDSFTIELSSGDLKWTDDSYPMNIDGQIYHGTSDLALPGTMDYPQGPYHLKISDDSLNTYEIDLELEASD